MHVICVPPCSQALENPTESDMASLYCGCYDLSCYLFHLLYLIVSSMCAIIIGCMCGTYYFGITDCMYFICAG